MTQYMSPNRKRLIKKKWNNKDMEIMKLTEFIRAT